MDPLSSKASLPLTPEDVICIPSSFIDKYFGESGTQCRRPVLTNCDPGVHRDLITKIASSRNHASTDRMLEYRIEIPPSQLVQIALMSIRGMRPLDPLSVSQQNPSSFSYCTPKNVPHDSDSTIRLWVPASMMDEVHPNLVAEYEDKLTREAQGSQTKCTKGSERGGQERDKSTIPLPSPTWCHISSGESFDSTRTLPERDLQSTSESSSWQWDGPSNGHFLFSMLSPDDSSYSDSECDNLDSGLHYTLHFGDIAVVDGVGYHRGR